MKKLNKEMKPRKGLIWKKSKEEDGFSWYAEDKKIGFSFYIGFAANKNCVVIQRTVWSSYSDDPYIDKIYIDKKQKDINWHIRNLDGYKHSIVYLLIDDLEERTRLLRSLLRDETS